MKDSRYKKYSDLSLEELESLVEELETMSIKATESSTNFPNWILNHKRKNVKKITKF